MKQGQIGRNLNGMANTMCAGFLRNSDGSMGGFINQERLRVAIVEHPSILERI